MTISDCPIQKLSEQYFPGSIRIFMIVIIDTIGSNMNHVIGHYIRNIHTAVMTALTV